MMTIPPDLQFCSVVFLGVHVALLMVGMALVLGAGLHGWLGRKAIRPLPSPELIWALPLIIALAWWASRGMPICFDTSSSAVLALASLTSGVMGLISVFVLGREMKLMERGWRIDVNPLVGVPHVCAISRFSIWQGGVVTLVNWMRLEMPLALVVVLGAFCAVGWVYTYLGVSMSWYRLTWGATPFDRSLPSFDMFLSYKSENAAIARRVADQLSGSGIAVWFAEYFILVGNRERFQAYVDEGISRSDYGLVLTNNLWAQSKYTRLEIVQMRKAYGAEASRRILEVKLPEEPWEKPYTREEHEPFEILRHTQSVPVQPDPRDVNRILEFVQEHTGWEVRPMSSATESGPFKRFSSRHMGHPYHLDIGGWDVKDQSGRRSADGDVAGPVLRRQLGSRRMGASLILGTDPPGERLTDGVQRLSDRDLYNKLIDSVVAPYLELSGADPRGVHLLFHGGFSQLAITYWSVLVRAWVRMYSIILPCPGDHDGRAGEFVFTCFFHGPFSEYLQSVPVMDRLVTSLTWERCGTSSPEENQRIIEAVNGADLATIRKMLAENPSLVNTGGVQGGTVLHTAALGNCTPAVELLVSLGADVNARTDEGSLTPLHCLAAKGTAEAARVLLDHGADVNARNEDGWTPLHYASLAGNTGVAETLLNSRADIGARQTNGWTPLHVAAMNGHASVAQLLVDRGSDVNARSPAGATPLHVAAGKGRMSVAEFLLTAGADINARSRLGETPLALAIKHGQFALATWLRRSGGVE